MFTNRLIILKKNNTATNFLVVNIHKLTNLLCIHHLPLTISMIITLQTVTKLKQTKLKKQIGNNKYNKKHTLITIIQSARNILQYIIYINK